MSWGTVEEEPEVGTGWRRFRLLTSVELRSTSIYLRSEGPLLDEPYTKQLDGKLRELRFYLGRRAMRITYWIASGRRIVLLTVFAKTRGREEREVERARRAMAACLEQGHTLDDEGFDMTEQRATWREMRDRRMNEPEAREAYQAAQLAFSLGAKVRSMRESLGWTQSELARRAGLTQPAMARFEAGGTVPTLLLLHRLARALESRLTVEIGESEPASRQRPVARRASAAPRKTTKVGRSAATRTAGATPAEKAASDLKGYAAKSQSRVGVAAKAAAKGLPTAAKARQAGGSVPARPSRDRRIS